jgi:hypothetical protein
MFYELQATDFKAYTSNGFRWDDVDLSPTMLLNGDFGEDQNVSFGQAKHLISTNAKYFGPFYTCAHFH